MRVIAGKAKGRPLKSPRGRRVRPTSDKVKEAYFSIVNEFIEGSAYLDLFAGTGGMGIEALSRGAKKAVFVENDRLSLRALQENLHLTRLSEAAEVIAQDVFRALNLLHERRESFDLIYIDPYYDYESVPEILVALEEKELVAEGGLVCLERDARFKEEWPDLSSFTSWKTRQYSKTMLHFFISS